MESEGNKKMQYSGERQAGNCYLFQVSMNVPNQLAMQTRRRLNAVPPLSKMVKAFCESKEMAYRFLFFRFFHYLSTLEQESEKTSARRTCGDEATTRVNRQVHVSQS